MMETKSRKWATILAILIAGFTIFLIPVEDALSEETYEFERMWPTLHQPWYFLWPGGVAIDENGYVYVADTWNNRIQKFNSNGEFITKWGSHGSNYSEFDNPSEISIDETGFVYVIDSHNHRVQKFTFNGEFITEWGSEGTSEGQFGGGCLTVFECGPQGIAVDEEGNVYVADTSNNRVQKFTSDGVFITEWGDYGSGDGQFNYPAAIAIDMSGNVYVIDTGNSRIQKFTSDGDYITKWGSEGSGDGEFGGTNQALFDFEAGPQGIAVDEEGNVYVADTVNKRIQQFTSDGQFITKWGSWGPEDGQFNLPQGIAIDENGKIFVAGDGHIQKFTSEGNFIANWANEGSGNGEFCGPQGIATDESENVYVADSSNHRIQKFTSDGDYIAKWGSEGSGDTEFQYPEGIAVDTIGNVYVVDAKNVRIQKFTSDGQYITKWGSAGSEDGQFGTGEEIPDPHEFAHLPQGIAVDGNGNVYVVDTGNNRIQKFTSDGLFITKWGSEGVNDGKFSWPSGIAVDGSGNIYVVDTGNNRIQKFTSDGQFITKWGIEGSGEGDFVYVDGIATDQNGNVYVIDSYNNRIQKFTSEGEFISTFGVFGSEPGGLNRPNYLCVGPTGRVYVSDSSNARIQVFFHSDSDDTNGVSKTIIVAGGGPFPGNNLWDATQMNTNYAYRALTYQGYTKETIYYLSSDTDLDLDGNGELDDVDAYATNANLQTAITSWATDASDLTIYITDHGGDQNFRMGELELLSDQELNTWLNQLQAATNMRVIIIYDACESGSFLAELASTVYDRIFIASTSQDQQAYFTSMGQISFSYFFWGNIFNGMSLYDSYLLSQDAVEYSYSLQTPLLNADGNDTGNEDSDMDLIQGINIGNGVVSADDIPVIGSISDTTTLNGETQASIFADNVIDANGISRVWAIITPPDDGTADPSNPVLDLPEIELTNTSGNLYEGSYDGFSQRGTYNVAVFAMDTRSMLSIPKSTQVIQTAGLGYSTLNSALNMTISCVEFQGVCYQITLEYYSNSSDTLNLFWKLDINSIGINQTCDSDCASMDSDLQITIPKIEFEGNFYQSILNKYLNPIDPFGFYWMLDLASIQAL
jgi:sugar lactone lactonase YvrE